MNTRLSKAILAALVLGGIASTAALAGEINPNVNVQMRPTGKGWGEVVSDAHGPISTAVAAGGITNHGGPVIASTVNVYLIWYGNNWGTLSGTQARNILTNLAGSIGGTPYYNINKTYAGVTGAVHYAGSTSVAGGSKKPLSDSNILTIAQNAVKSAFGNVVDPNGLYFVLTSSEVKKSGFGTSYCGWHSHASFLGGDMKYSFVGDPSVQYPNNCGAQVLGPNGNSGGDAMASVFAHELEETNTDPDLNAWYDSAGAENADLCAWTFGTESTAGNGAKYNVTMGGSQYLIQQNWNYNATVSLQKCAMQ